MTDRKSISFIHAGELVELSDVGPNETVLDYLRLRKHLTGTKEGCGEGDCGACTVAIGQRVTDENSNQNGQIVYQPVNSCIQLLGSLDGKELISVEDLATGPQDLHPVQSAMVEHHGSQCGFCTPGFIMSLFVLQHEGQNPERQKINDALAGNLCRCTGYRPIVEAAKQACTSAAPERATGLHALLGSDSDVFIGDDNRFFASPTSRKSLATLINKFPQAVIIAGATDVGLWITKQLRELPQVIYLGQVKSLQQISLSKDVLTIGAGVTYAQALPQLEKLHKDIGNVVRRIGSKQVRSVGTVGGNIANGSPIGDMPPMLIALNAQIQLHSVDGSRDLALENFFIEYGKQNLDENEYLAQIEIPLLKSNQRYAAYKISKRFDQDISAIMAAFCLSIDDGKVSAARCAFGGMAGTPMLAAQTQQALIGLTLDDESGWQDAAENLADDFAPMSDMRASADYRMNTAKALLMKCRAELSGEINTRVLDETHLESKGQANA